MARVLVCLSASLLLLAAAAEARRSTSPAYPAPCATIGGPAWSQTIDETAWLPSPKKARLLELHGTRYHVFVDGVRCAWAARNVARLVPLLVPARLTKA